jgi:RNA polymerase sigma-70 factor (ECF subfamily)
LAREQLQKVWTAVEKLSKMQRQVFLLRFVEEMELLEIAEAMQMKESTVKSHLYRALHAVRSKVQTETDGNE